MSESTDASKNLDSLSQNLLTGFEAIHKFAFLCVNQALGCLNQVIKSQDRRLQIHLKRLQNERIL